MSALTWILLGIDGLALLMILSLFIFLRYFVYSFLACNRRIYPAEILIVEGWLEELSLSAVIDEFNHGAYQYLVTVGGPWSMGPCLAQNETVAEIHMAEGSLYLMSCLAHYTTLAELAAAKLIALDFEPRKLITVASEEVSRDRTVATAIAFKKWLSEHKGDVRGVNIYSNNIHARRSHLIYQKHLPKLKVGVIAGKVYRYAPDRWWQSSLGLKTILMELIAYCYVVYRSIRTPSADYDY
ncbi:MAG: hypothetical protein AAGH78_12975 [Cyanobacteria bacterium P01_H01_bin.58]